MFHRDQDRAPLPIGNICLPQICARLAKRVRQLGVDGRRAALSLARVSGPKRVTLALAGGVSPDEDAFSVEPPDAVRLRHSNSSTDCLPILSILLSGRN